MAAGRIALIVGFVAVIGFMIVSYSLFGVFANVALIANLVLIMAVLSGLQATLTLPGIAGIVLTVGMAVDANVLIFERIREELASGKNPIIAIDMGYSRALGTFLTPMSPHCWLRLFCSSLVQGRLEASPSHWPSALDLCIYRFCADRLLVSLWLRRQGKPEALPI